MNIDYNKILNRNMINVFKDVLVNIFKNGLVGNNHLFVTFNTNHKKIKIPKWLLKKYPNQMTIVIQHEYFNLKVNKSDFEITLSFDDKKVDLKITYDAIVSFADPSASFGLILNNNNKKEIHEQKNLKKESKIIKLADFKKINPNNNG